MQTKLDQIANQNHLQLLKALLPHLPMKNQRTFSLLIKTIEIRNVMDYYNRSSDFSHHVAPPGDSFHMQDPLPADYHECEIPNKQAESADLLGILADIRQYCEDEDQEMIDQILQMVSMIELYRVCAESDL